jgi:hypothetical protein
MKVANDEQNLRKIFYHIAVMMIIHVYRISYQQIRFTDGEISVEA